MMKTLELRLQNNGWTLEKVVPLNETWLKYKKSNSKFTYKVIVDPIDDYVVTWYKLKHPEQKYCEEM